MAKQARAKSGVVGTEGRRGFESMEHVKVVARLRPPEPQEVVAGEAPCLRMTGNLHSLELCEPSSLKKKVFHVDRVLGPSCEQREVYEDWARPLVISATRGYNATIFAYGHTGSGKSYTMMGTAQEPGITPRAVRDVFREIDRAAKARDDAVFLVHVSYVELYNNVFRNLLDGFGEASDKKKIEIRESKSAGVFLSGPSNLRLAVRSEAEVRALVSFGDRARATSATLCNDHSSRSHAVLTLHIQSRDTMGKLNLVDLAGSERVSMSGARGETLVEAQNINLSLALLGDVLAALSRRARQQQHPDSDAAGSSPVPYRNSKLTHLLKDSLGGNSRTLMVANLRSHAMYYRQSLVTLMYATRAREIKNRTEIVVATSADDMGSSLKAVTMEIQSLHARLVAREQQFEALCQARVSTDEENKALRAKLAELEAANRTERSMLEARLGSVVYDHRGKLAKQQDEFRRLQARLKARLEEYQETCSKQQREIEDLRVRVSESASKTQVADMQRVLVAWQLQAVALQKELKQQREKFDGTFAAQAQAKAQLEAEFKDALEARRRADATTAEARRQIDDYRKRIAYLEDEVRNVQAQKQHADTEAARHRDSAVAAAASKRTPDDSAARLASALQLMEELAERHEAEIQGRKQDRLDAAKARDSAAAAALAAGMAVGSKRGARKQACRVVSGWLMLLRSRRVAHFYMRWRAEALQRKMAADSREALRRQRDIFEQTRIQVESSMNDVRHEEVEAAVAASDAQTRRRVREDYEASLAARTAKIRQEEAHIRKALEVALRARESELDIQRRACKSEVVKAVKHRETVLAAEHDQRIHDLESQRRQIAAVLAERDEVEKRRVTEERRRIALQHQAKLAEFAERHEAALEEERARGVKVLLEHKARSTEELGQQREALICEHNAALDATVAKYQALLEDARRREAAILKDHEVMSRELLKDQRAQLVAEHRATLADVEAQYNASLNEAGRLHAAAIAECESRISTELQRQRDNLVTEHHTILETAAADHVASLEEVRCRADAMSADHASALARELERQRQTLSADHKRVLATSIAKERQEARAREAALVAKHEDEMARELQRQREHLVSSHEESLATTLAKFQAFLDEARQREADIIAEQQKNLAEQLDHQRCALVSEHESALSKLEAHYQAALDDVRNQEALHLVEFQEKLEHQQALRESEHARHLASAERKIREAVLKTARDREDALAREHTARLAQEVERQRDTLVTQYESALKDADAKYQTSRQDALANEASLKADIEKRVKAALDRQHESMTAAHNASLAEVKAQCEALRDEARIRENELSAQYETRLSHQLEQQKRELSTARDSAIANIEDYCGRSIDASRAREAVLAAEAEARITSCLETQRHALGLQHESAHGETIAKYEALLEEARAREIALTAEQSDHIARELDEQRRALVAAHQLALTGLRAKHEVMLEEVQDRETELKRGYDQKLERQREELMASHQIEISAAEEREARVAKERDAQLVRELETLRQVLASEHKAAVAETIAKYETILEAARAHEVALTAKHQALAQDLEGQRQAVISAHQASTTELKAKYEAKIKDANDREIKLAQEHEQQLEDQRVALVSEYDNAVSASRQREACLLEEHNAHVAAELESQRRALTLEHEAAITVLVAKHEALFEEARMREATLRADHDARLTRHLNEERQTLASEKHLALAESKAKYEAMLEEARDRESELMREHNLQLENQRKELAANQDTAISAARERETSLTEKFHVQLAAEMEIQRHALASEHNAAQAKKIAQYEELLKEARGREVALVADHDVQLSRDLSEQRQALVAAHQVALADLKSKYEAKLDEEHNRISTLTRECEQQLERQRVDFATERNNAKLIAREREVSLDKERNAHWAHELSTQRQALISEHKAQLAATVAQYDTMVEEARAREAALTAEHEDRLGRELGEQRQALLAAHRAEVNDIKAKYESMFVEARNREIVLMKGHKNQLERQRGRFVVEHNDAMSAAREREALLEKKCDTEIARELEIQRNALTCEYEAAHAKTVAKYEALLEDARASEAELTKKRSDKLIPHLEQLKGAPCQRRQTKEAATREAVFDDAQDRVADSTRAHEEQMDGGRCEFAFERHDAVENEAVAFTTSLKLAHSAVTIFRSEGLNSEHYNVLSGNQEALVKSVAKDKVPINDVQSQEVHQMERRGDARIREHNAMHAKCEADPGDDKVDGKTVLNAVHTALDCSVNQEFERECKNPRAELRVDARKNANQKQVPVLSAQEAAKMRQSATCQEFDARLSRELERQSVALESQHQLALAEAAAKHEMECKERWEHEVQAKVARECRRMGLAYEAALKQAREEVLKEQTELRRSERDKLEAAHREALASAVSSCEVKLATKREAFEQFERASREALKRREDELVESHERRLITAVNDCRREHELDSALRRRDAALCAALRWLVERVWSMYMHDLEKYRRNWETTLFGGKRKLINTMLVAHLGVNPPTTWTLSPAGGSPSQRRRIDDMVARALRARDSVTLEVVARMLRRRDENSAAALEAALRRANSRHVRRVSMLIKLRDTYWQELLKAALRESDTKHSTWRSEAVRASQACERRPLEEVGNKKQDMSDEIRELKLQLERERQARWDLLSGAMKEPIAPAAHVDIGSRIVAAAVQGDATGLRAIFDDAGLTSLNSPAAHTLRCSTQSILPVHRALAGWSFHGDRVKLLKTLEVLIAAGADLSAPDSNGDTALHRALVGLPGLEMITFLLDHGARVDATNALGNTPLHIVARKLDSDAHDKAHALLERGAEPSALNSQGHTPLDVASHAAKTEAQRSLVRSLMPLLQPDSNY